MSKNSLLTLAFLEGGLVMLLETSSPLIVAPILGNSIAIWATMISLSIGALALGYFLGGYISKKTNDIITVGKMFTLNAALILIGWLMLYFQNYGPESMATATFSYLIIAIVLFIPLVIFGATTPVLVAVLKESHSVDKSVVGRLYSVSTFGGIIFSLLSGYLFIPEMGIGDTILVATILTGIGGFIVLKNHSKLKFVTVASSVIGFLSMFYNPSFQNDESFKILYSSESINGQLLVAEYDIQGHKQRILFINRMGQTWVNAETNNSNWPYANFLTISSSIYPKGSNTLVLGLGGGVVPSAIYKHAGHRVDAVELDQRIVDISLEYFNMSKSIDVHTEDARRYIKKAEKKYEFIVFDIFNGEILPSHCLSLEAFEDTKSILADGGLIAINFNGFINGKEGLPGRSLIKTLQTAGFKIKIFDASLGKDKESNRNLIYYAYLKEPNWESMRFGLNTPEGERKIGNNDFMDIKKIDLSDAIVVTDDKPVMEYINRFAAKEWREAYTKNFTLKFKEEHKLPFTF